MGSAGRGPAEADPGGSGGGRGQVQAGAKQLHVDPGGQGRGMGGKRK